MFAWFRRRYLDLLGSIYIYNEHRGYTSIDRVLEAVRGRMARTTPPSSPRSRSTAPTSASIM